MIPNNNTIGVNNAVVSSAKLGVFPSSIRKVIRFAIMNRHETNSGVMIWLFKVKKADTVSLADDIRVRKKFILYFLKDGSLTDSGLCRDDYEFRKANAVG